MSFIVVAYYTVDTIYEMHVERLKESLLKFNIPHHVVGIENRGDWYKNTCYKPTFIKEMMEKFPGLDIVYVDADARFKAYPQLFEELKCDVAVHNFDRRHHKTKGVSGFEILSGTIFFRNCPEVMYIVYRWETECAKRPRVWDQKSLARVIGDYHNLPEEYCTIFDTMRHVKEPVIVHYQASRQVRKNKGRLKMRSTC